MSEQEKQWADFLAWKQDFKGPISFFHWDQFIRDFSWAAWQASRRAALDEAWDAVHAERLADPTEHHDDVVYQRAVADCENAIRALSAPAEDGGSAAAGKITD